MGNKCAKEGCGAWALKNDIRCFRHSEDPTVIEARNRASSKGGKKSRKYPVVREQLPDIFFELKTPKDLAAFLEMVINGAMQNTLDLKKATTLGYLSNIMRGILEKSELEERLEKLEEALYARN